MVRQGSAHPEVVIQNITRLIQITRLLLGIACLWVCRDINVKAELHHRQLESRDICLAPKFWVRDEKWRDEVVFSCS